MLILHMRQWSIPSLRVALSIVFLWFGVLKILDASPVADLVARTYFFFPEPDFLRILGIWEVLIGAGLLFKFSLRLTLFLLWFQMAGTLASPLFDSSLFFSGGNPFFLTMEGEFLVKNLVLIAASLVIGGFEVRNKT